MYCDSSYFSLLTSDPEASLSDQTGPGYLSALTGLEADTDHLRAVYSSSVATKVSVSLGSQATLQEQDQYLPINASSILGSNPVVYVRDYLRIEGSGQDYGVFVLSNNSLATFYTQTPTFDSNGRLITFA